MEIKTSAVLKSSVSLSLDSLYEQMKCRWPCMSEIRYGFLSSIVTCITEVEPDLLLGVFFLC